MVGFFSEQTIEDIDRASKLKNSKDPPDPADPKPNNDSSFVDSLLDFESIEDWFKDIPNPDMAETEHLKLEEGPIRHETIGEVPIRSGSDPIVSGSGCMAEEECQIPEILSCSVAEELGKVSLIGGSDKFPASDGGNDTRSDRCEQSSGLDSGNGMKIEIASCNSGEKEAENNEIANSISKSEVEGGNGAKSEEGSSESESESSESSSASSSSSSGSSDDDSSDDGDEKEDGKGKMQVEVECAGAGEIEEGEIRDDDGGLKAETAFDSEYENDDDEDDQVAAWTDAEMFDDEEEEAPKGPIRSKNELAVLPPIPPVNVTLEPHHQMTPVGVILSVLGTQVIVEGVEKHNPLSEGSILWITESRSPLGLIDEIFGPVINPYYVVRHNSESEIPAGIQVGTSVSFVPEFADHVLNNKDVYKKGYDVSGQHDEEISDSEFSDDEKEAEYRKMQKLTKRGMEDQNLGNTKNDRRKGKKKQGAWNNGQPSPQQTPDAVHLPHQQKHHFSPVAPSVDPGYCPPSSAEAQGFVGTGPPFGPPFPAATQVTGINTASNGVWTNGMPFQPPNTSFPDGFQPNNGFQPQNTSFPNGFPNNGLPWLAQFNPQYPYQMPFCQPGQQVNAFAAPGFPQMLMGQGFNQATFGIGLQGQPTPAQQLNPFAQPMYQPGFVGQQEGFNQNMFGMGMGQQTHPQAHPTLNADQGMMSNGLHVEQNHNMPPSAAIADNVNSQQFIPGSSSNHGRVPSASSNHGRVPSASSNHGRGPPRGGGRHFGRGRGRGRGFRGRGLQQPR